MSWKLWRRECNSFRGITRLSLSEENFTISNSSAAKSFSQEIEVPGRVPIFGIMTGSSGGYEGFNDSMKLVEGNPEATIIIGCLKVE